MKLINIRVNNSFMDRTLEVTAGTSIYDAIKADIAARATVATSGFIRVKSVVFRSLNVFGDSPVSAFGRSFFAMFRSNVMESIIKPVDHFGGLTFTYIYDPADGFVVGVESASLAPVSWVEPLEAETGVTIVLKYSYCDSIN